MTDDQLQPHWYSVFGERQTTLGLSKNAQTLWILFHQQLDKLSFSCYYFVILAATYCRPCVSVWWTVVSSETRVPYARVELLSILVHVIRCFPNELDSLTDWSVFKLILVKWWGTALLSQVAMLVDAGLLCPNTNGWTDEWNVIMHLFNWPWINSLAMLF